MKRENSDIVTLPGLHAFFYKHHLYKHRQPQICPKVKHHPSTNLSLKTFARINFYMAITYFSISKSIAFVQSLVLLYV